MKDFSVFFDAMNVELLLARAKQNNRLAEAELEFVRRALADEQSREDPYTLIHILWKACDARSQHLIWLRAGDSDEMVRRISLQALTALAPSDAVFNLALRMAHDPSDYVRMVAARAIGTLGALLPERTTAAARVLLAGFQRGQSEASSEYDWYYEGMLELLRIPHNKRPLPTRELRSTDIDSAVIAAARSLAE